MAREMYEITREGLREALAGAPEILFVGGAGNSDNDITFDEWVPPMFDMPNLLIAGAVDQAGEATTFTSFGPTVNVYANGFEVESYVPGGDRVKFSGTSMSAPNVTNLAAKLIALRPSLTPPEVIALILDASDERQEGDQQLRIINPQRSAELLAERFESD
jgi:subtilisin family serine protease